MYSRILLIQTLKGATESVCFNKEASVLNLEKM